MDGGPDRIATAQSPAHIVPGPDNNVVQSFDGRYLAYCAAASCSSQPA